MNRLSHCNEDWGVDWVWEMSSCFHAGSQRPWSLPTPAWVWWQPVSSRYRDMLLGDWSPWRRSPRGGRSCMDRARLLVVVFMMLSETSTSSSSIFWYRRERNVKSWPFYQLLSTKGNLWSEINLQVFCTSFQFEIYARIWTTYNALDSSCAPNARLAYSRE